MATRELTDAHKENYSEGVVSRACGVDSNEAKALRVACMLVEIEKNDGVRLTAPELYHVVDARARALLAPLLPLLTDALRPAAERQVRREERQERESFERWARRRHTLPARRMMAHALDARIRTVPRARPMPRDRAPRPRRHPGRVTVAHGPPSRPSSSEDDPHAEPVAALAGLRAASIRAWAHEQRRLAARRVA